MALPPPPPRQTGDPNVDLPSMIQWAHAFYQAAVIEEAFLQTAAQLADSTFDPTTLPDPASTTVAQAQQTANEAYILADAADTKADTAQTGVNLLELKDVETGTVTVAASSTTATVTFAAAQADTNFYPILTPSGYTGTPPIGATEIIQISKTTAGFTITVNASTGVGNTVTFNYHVHRNS